MTDAAFHRPYQGTQAETVSLPKPQPFAAPVLIGDCASPLAGDTILALLWRRLDRSDDG